MITKGHLEGGHAAKTASVTLADQIDDLVQNCSTVKSLI